MIVRRARPADEPEWWRVWDESARAAFAALLPEGHAFPERDTARWHALHADAAATMMLAEEEGEILGLTVSGESRDPDAGDEVGEVRMLFAAAGRWRRGVGSALMAAALDDLRQRGRSEATVWSFAANDRANRFYERCGFERDGAERTEREWADLLEVRYRRAL